MPFVENGAAGGGGSSAPVNWAKVTLQSLTLTVAANSDGWGTIAHPFVIASQAGSDFSVNGQGQIESAAGGRFQCAGYCSYDTPALDGGSTAQRFLWYGAVLGDMVAAVAGAGLDVNVPVFAGDVLNAGDGVMCVASSIGYTAPGGVALTSVSVALIAGSGTDSVPTYTDPFLIWQV